MHINHPLFSAWTHIKQVRISRRFIVNKWVKRIFDVCVASSAILILSPLLVLVAILIKIDSRGPVFFKQTRVGQSGQRFEIYKFRSMEDQAEARLKDLEPENEMEQGVLFKIKCDPRITRVGKIIRKTSIDELPQLFNVLIGNMALVGPRPPLCSEVERYEGREFLRLSVLPGITCVWQINGRSEIPFKQQVAMDLEYIEKQSLAFDIKLLLLTIPAVLTARGAY